MTPQTHSIEALLAESSWLRKLAHSLLRDPAGAEDLYQETMLVALQRRLSMRGSFRPWLAGIARRLAAGNSRSQARQRRREQLAAQLESQPSAAAVVEQFTTQRLVADAVLSLAEPYRSTVLLRFWEGLPPREVARRMAAPVETVRTRLKRGMEQLRGKLDQEFGEREAWICALQPWTRGRELPWIPVLLSAALLLAMLVPFMSVPDGLRRSYLDPDSRELEARVVDSSGRGIANLLVVEGWDQTSGAEPSAADGSFRMPRPGGRSFLRVEASEHLTLTPLIFDPHDFDPSVESSIVAVPRIQVGGRVLDEEGDPLVGARLSWSVPDRFRAAIGAYSIDPTAEVFSARSDERGRFALPYLGLLPGSEILVEQGGYLPRRLPIPEKSRQDLELSLRPVEFGDAALTGMVTDQQGDAVAAAVILLGSVRTETSPDGSFTILEEQIGDGDSIWVHKKGHRAKEYSLQQLAGDPTLVLGEASLDLHGRLADAAGQALSGVQLALASPSSIPIPFQVAKVRSDAQGRFHLQGLAAAEHRLRLTLPGSLATVELGPFAAGSNLGELRLAAADLRKLQGGIEDAAGHPLSGVHVELYHPDFKDLPGSSASSDLEGRFDLGPCGRDGLRLRLRGPDIFPLDLELEDSDQELLIRAAPRGFLQWQGPRPAAAAAIQITDAAGRILPLDPHLPDSARMRASLRAGPSKVFSVSTRARHCIILAEGKPLLEQEIRILPGQLLVLANH